jgi:hypothetical protein
LIVVVVKCGKASSVSADNVMGIVGKVVMSAVRRIVDLVEKMLLLQQI